MLNINTIYLGDCIELFKSIDDESVDLVLTDPPYLKDYQSNHRKKTPKLDKIDNDEENEDNRELIKEAIKESYRVLKPNTSCYMFCDWHNIEFFKVEFEKVFNIKNLLIWKKNNWTGGDLDGAFAHQYEMILYGHKGRDKRRGTRLRDVLEYDRVRDDTHPNRKPIDLLSLLIRNSSDIGDLVLDPFMGSGSTPIAARFEHRNFIGIELNKKFYDYAAYRLDNELIQLELIC